MPSTAQARPHKVFISYRRSDTAYPAGWLYQSLAERFGDDSIFKDVDSVHPGDDFIEAVANAVGGCDVLLALIGSTWLSCARPDGGRRLDEPDDLVRLEIETALNRGVRVIPVLVEGATMPDKDDVPSSLAKLLRRHAVELSANRFNADLEIILRAIGEVPTTAGPQVKDTPSGGQRWSTPPTGERTATPPYGGRQEQPPPQPPPQPPQPPWRPPPRPRDHTRVSGALVTALVFAAIGAVLLLLGAGEPLLADGGDLFIGTTIQDVQHAMPSLLVLGSFLLIARPSAAAGWLVGAGWAAFTLDYAATTVYAATRVGYEDAAFGTSSLTLRSIGAAFVLVGTFVAPSAIDRPKPSVAAPIALALVGAGLLVVFGSANMRFGDLEGMPEWVGIVAAAGPATLLVLGVAFIASGLDSASAAAPVVTAAGVTGTVIYAIELWVRMDYDLEKTSEVTLALAGFLLAVAVGAWLWVAPSNPPRPVRSRTAY